MLRSSFTSSVVHRIFRAKKTAFAPTTFPNTSKTRNFATSLSYKNSSVPTFNTMADSAATSNTESPAENNGQPAPAMTKSAAKKQAKLEASRAAKATKAKAIPTPPSNNNKTSEQKEKKKPVSSKEEEAPYINNTPSGDKKDLSEPMASGYNPIAVESAWYDWWEKEGFFKPEITGDDSAGTFVIPAPPPNVTGSLHIGHALAIALQDCLCRWYRMRGYTVLWNPGLDHAGIATQSVVEKRLMKTTGESRRDLGREKFLERVWMWKDEYQERITSQIRRQGASNDWSRLAFTMNSQLSTAVIESFVRLHEEGTIYRANRLVNWCVKLNTALSNLEVDQKEIPGRTLLHVPGFDERVEFGVIVSFAYEIDGTDEKIIVATTRPETMLGDTAIAVHPDDERYKHLHGKFAKHPFIDRKMPIVCDSTTVDMSFGTGAVKITPAHDPNDYDCGKRNNLEFINILNDDGTLNENAGPQFAGMHRFKARREVLKALEERGLFVEKKDNPMNIPLCSKSGDVVEPIMKPQWWVSCTDMAQEAIKRTRAGELNIRPKSSEDDWYRWLETIQDWCISRQLWWGHRCPVYYVNIEGQVKDEADGERWISGRSLEEAHKKAQQKFPNVKFTLEQDEDVLDTWFSSGLWPFSIMGWPNETPDLEKFYPASVLETGWDILFFWVARMVMLGIKLTDKMPFSEVYCHPLIRDAHGRKMSKSLGNVIDPVDVIQGTTLEKLHEQLLQGNLDPKEVEKAKKGQAKDFPKGFPQCGTDALRFALCNYTSGGRDINMDVSRIEGYRHFCNKIWNAVKFSMMKLGDDFVPNESAAPAKNATLAERWILHRLSETAAKVNKNMEERAFLPATNALYSFWWGELCDVFIEAAKPITDPSADAEVRSSARNTLYTCIDGGLRLLHPFMPFVSEELWQRLPRRPDDATPSIMLARYPTVNAEWSNEEAERLFKFTQSVAESIRSQAGKYGLQSGLQAHVQIKSPALRDTISSQIPIMSALIKGLKTLEVHETAGTVPTGCINESIGTEAVVYLLVKGLIDINAEIEKSSKKIAFAQRGIDKIVNTKNTPNYETKIPEHIRQREDEKMRELEAEISALKLGIEKFRELEN